MSRPPLTRCAVANEFARVAVGRNVAQRDERPHVDTARLGRDRAEEREALERGTAGRRFAPEEVVVDEHTVEPGVFRRARDRDRDLRILHERRQREPDPDRHGTSCRARTAAPIPPARSPSWAGTIATAGR